MVTLRLHLMVSFIPFANRVMTFSSGIVSFMGPSGDACCEREVHPRV